MQNQDYRLLNDNLHQIQPPHPAKPQNPPKNGEYPPSTNPSLPKQTSNTPPSHPQTSSASPPKVRPNNPSNQPHLTVPHPPSPAQSPTRTPPTKKTSPY